MSAPNNVPPISGPSSSKFYFGLDNVQHHDLVRFGVLPNKAAEWPDGKEKPVSHTKFTNTFLEHYLPTIFPHLETHDIFILISPLGYEIPIDRNTGYPLMVEEEDMRIWIQEQEETAHQPTNPDDHNSDDANENEEESNSESQHYEDDSPAPHSDHTPEPAVSQSSSPDISISQSPNSQSTISQATVPQPTLPQPPESTDPQSTEPHATDDDTNVPTQPKPTIVPVHPEKTAITVYPKIAPLRRVLHRIDMKTVPKDTQRIHVNAVGYWNYRIQYVAPRHYL